MTMSQTKAETVVHSKIIMGLREMADELDAHFNGTAARTRDEIRQDVVEAMARRNQEMRPASPALAAELMKRNARPTA